MLFYGSIVRGGFTSMRRALASVRDDVKSILSGKWRPTDLSLIMLLIFSALLWGLF